jgi:tagaturonate reductase
MRVDRVPPWNGGLPPTVTPTPILNRALLASAPALPENLECGPLEEFPERIIQFGEGNFLRGFTDWMVDVMNSQGLFQGRAVIVQPIQVGIAKVLNDQDGLYTLILRGVQDGEVAEQRRIITAVSRGLNPYDEWAEVVRCACHPGIRFLFSNTTEAGIAYVREGYDGSNCPESFPAKITALLWERYQALGGSKAQGLVFLPCELIDRNGDNLRAIVLKHAEEWKLEDPFVTWIREENYFLNTLVDRIVPGYPAAEAEALKEELGYTDSLLDTGEIFHLWVIEGPDHIAAEIPFHQAGLNVVWTRDMTPYRTRKVRILNGAHTCSVLAAFLTGMDTVLEMMEDEVFAKLLHQAVFDEIMPTFNLDESEKARYAQAVLERFRNPFVRHELLSISLNSVSKWKVRVLPSLLDYQRLRGSLPPALVFSLAALILFYKGVGTSDRELRGTRNGKSYPVRDDLDVLSFFEKRWHAFSKNHDLRALVAVVLANESLWGADLTTVPGLMDAVTANLQAMLVDGVRTACKTVTGEPALP